VRYSARVKARIRFPTGVVCAIAGMSASFKYLVEVPLANLRRLSACEGEVTLKAGDNGIPAGTFLLQGAHV
jgi:hypothetical protein